MSIKIKFSFDELRRRAAKMLEVSPMDIDNVCPSEGGIWLPYSCHRQYG